MSSDALNKKEELLKKQAEARQKSAEEKENNPNSQDEEKEEIPSVPLREDMVSNAVKFLSHENVKKTPLVRRVAFLEQKGLTNEEITEALRRIGGGETNPIKNNTNNLPNQNQQQNLPPVPQRIQYVQPPPPPPPSTFKTVATSIVLTLSAVGGAAWLYNSFIRKQMEKNSITDNEQQKTKTTENNNNTNTNNNDNLQASMSELVQVMKNQQTEVKDTLKMVHTVLTTPDKFQNNRNNLTSSTDQINVRELTNAITELHSLIKTNSTNLTPISTTPIKSQENYQKKQEENIFNTTPLRSVPKSSNSVGNATDNSSKSENLSFQDVMKVVSAGGVPSNVRKDIDDSPSDPSAVISPSSTKTPLKPWQQRRKERVSSNQSTPQNNDKQPAYLQKYSSPSASPAPASKNDEENQIKTTEDAEIENNEQVNEDESDNNTEVKETEEEEITETKIEEVSDEN